VKESALAPYLLESIAHRLRNPLTAISTKLQVAEMTEQHLDVKSIAALQKEVKRLSMIIHDFSVMLPRNTQEIEVLDLRDILRETVEVSRDLGEKEIPWLVPKKESVAVFDFLSRTLSARGPISLHLGKLTEKHEVLGTRKYISCVLVQGDSTQAFTPAPLSGVENCLTEGTSTGIYCCAHLLQSYKYSFRLLQGDSMQIGFSILIPDEGKAL
jgi:signal transduction histidine kinase